MEIFEVLSLLSPNSANLFAKGRIDMGVEQMIYNAAYQWRIPLEIKLFAVKVRFTSYIMFITVDWYTVSKGFICLL